MQNTSIEYCCWLIVAMLFRIYLTVYFFDYELDAGLRSEVLETMFKADSYL